MWSGCGLSGKHSKYHWAAVSRRTRLFREWRVLTEIEAGTGKRADHDTAEDLLHKLAVSLLFSCVIGNYVVDCVVASA